jgi:hypothetical protein
MTSTPSLIEGRKRLLRDYFTEHTDIDRHNPFTAFRDFCSMEHVNLALEGPGTAGDCDEVHAIPKTGGFIGMATIMVAFNDATSEEVLRSDAWRLGLLTRLPEATCSKAADVRRLEMIRDWLAGFGHPVRGALALTIGSDTWAGPCGLGTDGLWDVLNVDVVKAPRSIHEVLGISAGDYIGFLHTLICP